MLARTELVRTASPLARPVVLGASVTGPSHLRTGMPCQDAFRSRVHPDGRIVLAVADGLGSASRAHTGARVAVNAAVAVSADATPARMLEVARASLEATADAEGCALRDLACTLLVVRADRHGAEAAHIGDGAIVAVTLDGSLMLSPPAPSEYVNETEPLTADGWRDHVRLSTCAEPLEGIVGFTDGVQHAALTARGEPSAGFLAPLVSFARETTDPRAADEELARLLAGAKLSEHSDDDKTIALAVW